jgi:HAD superfamily hydrolase (TIGR01509 family)
VLSSGHDSLVAESRRRPAGPRSSGSARPAPAVDKPTGAAGPPVRADLDALVARWRIVFHSAQDALHAADRCGRSLAFPAGELHERSTRLARERLVTAQLLDGIARDEHIQLHRRLSAPRATPKLLGLPDQIRACVFDLDGVLAGSSAIHAAAWADTFDEFLSRRVELTGERFAPFRPFDPATDYYGHIHGKPRLEGVDAFLASRGIRVPEGRPDDPPGAETVYGLANRKNEALLHRLDHEGVSAYAGARSYLEAAREAGLRCAVVSASANAATFLERAGLFSLISERVDGNTIRLEHLRSKPEPDTLLAACRKLGVPPVQAAAFETTLPGLAAGRAAGFGFIIGVDRRGRVDTLRAEGADLAVTDLTVLLDLTLAS